MMTKGEKMIWAAAFAASYAKCDVNAAENAMYAVALARTLAKTEPDAEWAPMLSEMLADADPMAAVRGHVANQSIQMTALPGNDGTITLNASSYVRWMERLLELVNER